MATVELRNVRKKFGVHEVIHGIDLLIEDQEFIAFVGPSGSGKSTLLRMIAGLEEVTEGEVLIDGSPAQNVPPSKRGLAMVFQSYALYPHMTVAENMSFSLRLAGIPKAERERKVRAVARILEMEPLLERQPRQLSGGQLQRVAIGRAMVRQPKAFLLDEPLSNLDAALQGQMRLELVRLHRELNTTMIYVTHDQLEAMTMADRIVVLNQGKVEQLGSPLELYQHPATLFVAGFIGAPKMNFLDAEIKTANDQHLILMLTNGASLAVPTPLEKLGAGEKIKLGVRAEHLTLESEGELQGEIEALEHLGPRAYLHARLADGTRVVSQTDGDTQARMGDRVAFRVRAEATHLFNASGKALARAGP
ncbi:MAG TPA: sn-glycerol-3-phosphate ABC transporter ATP-binding protein UgpC [Terriglobia bacterium]|nr:sn-glycerol-3-phosphate ABC transporter ATP-binding protein UgpC [Terriglobia bacterium]